MKFFGGWTLPRSESRLDIGGDPDQYLDPGFSDLHQDLDPEIVYSRKRLISRERF